LENNLLIDVETFAVNFITRNVPKDYAFHDLQHTISVVEAVQKIGAETNLEEEAMEILQIAAWFHDMGYDQGKEGHEERGCEYVANFLTPLNYSIETDEEWVSFELGFMQAHFFNTPVAQKLYGERKNKHIQKLERRQKKYTNLQYYAQYQRDYRFDYAFDAGPKV